MDASLLDTKLHIPAIPRGYVHRPKLYNKMDAVFGKKLCLISTPAGYGKTSLIVSWAQDRGLTPVWLSLDEHDNSFEMFFAYLISAIQKTDPDWGSGLFERLMPPQAIQHELFLNQFVNQLGHKDGDCVIVLDDFHMIQDKEIQDDLEYLLDNLPRRAHLVISTRMDPMFSVANLRAKGDLLEIRYPDLCFSTDEAENYLNEHFGLGLKEDEIQELVDYTEGWIVGLHLAAIALANTDRPATFITRLHLANRYITEYLIDEVLRIQSDDLQNFLLNSSVLPRFTADLCNSAFEIGNSQELIDEAERSNLFIIPLDIRQEWFRYHHLFSESLVNRLKRKDPQALVEIRVKSSQWFEQQGLLEEAVEYAMLAREYACAARIITKLGRSIIWTSSVGKLLNWLEALPDDILIRYPNLFTMLLWSYIHLSQFATVADALTGGSYEKIVQNIDENKKLFFESSISTVQALISINWKYKILEGLDYAEAGLESIDVNDESGGQSTIIYGKALMLAGDLIRAETYLEEFAKRIEKKKGLFIDMIVTHHLAELAMFKGDLYRAEELLKHAYQFGLDHHWDRISAHYRICIDMGRLQYERANFPAAYQLLNAAVRGSARTLIAYDILDGYLALFELSLKEQNLAAAKRRIQEVEYLAKNCGFPGPIMSRVDCMLTRVALRMRDLTTVQYWLDKQQVNCGFTYGFHERYEAYTAIEALVETNDLETAALLLETVLESAEKNHWGMDIIKCCSWLAAVDYLRGDLESALLFLSRAVTLGARQGYVQSILDCGDPIRPLLKVLRDRWVGASGKEVLASYVEKLMDSGRAGFVVGGGDWSDNLSVDPLTDRELTVLDLLYRGFSNQKIAETLVVSQNTVKFHLKNIYLKLGVSTRTQAVALASELKLI